MISQVSTTCITDVKQYKTNEIANIDTERVLAVTGHRFGNPGHDNRQKDKDIIHFNAKG
jgi:hypothetical protein